MRTTLPACILAVALLEAFSASGEALSRGIVYLDGKTLCDSQGPFLGLGVTYMQALRHCKYNPSRLDKELAFLSTCGFNYVRVLSMVDWQDQEISPVSHKNRQGQSIAAWPDYDTRLQELVDAVYSHGMRTQLTLFADAQYIMPDMEARRHHVQRVLLDLKDRDEKIILYEIANEAWQNGFPGTDGIAMLQSLGEEVAKHSQSLLALSSPPDIGNREEALRMLYANTPATIATIHFSRDLRTEYASWLPVLDCWNFIRYKELPPISSNEPVGPGSSVASEDDPEIILCATAFAYLAGLPMYVFHSAAGVKAEISFESMPWLGEFKSLLALLPADLPNWERFDGSNKDNPLKPQDNTINPLYNCCARKSDDFILLSLALDGNGRTFHVNADATLSVFSIMPIHSRGIETVEQGKSFALSTTGKACLIKGTVRH